MKKDTQTTKVILEFYMEIWYCYDYKNGSMDNPLFTSTSYEAAEGEAKEAGYEVVQVIEFVDEDETEAAPSTPVNDEQPQTCKQCGESYDKKKVKRVYGDLQPGFCSAGCFTESFMQTIGATTTKDEQPPLTYKVVNNLYEMDYYTDDKEEAYKVYKQYVSDYGDGIRLYEAEKTNDDEDPAEWELIEAFDEPYGEDLEDAQPPTEAEMGEGFTGGENWTVTNSNHPDYLDIDGDIRICSIDISEEILTEQGITIEEAKSIASLISSCPTLYRENARLKELLKWIVNEVETTPDELSDALLGMIKIKIRKETTI